MKFIIATLILSTFTTISYAQDSIMLNVYSISGGSLTGRIEVNGSSANLLDWGQIGNNKLNRPASGSLESKLSISYDNLIDSCGIELTKKSNGTYEYSYCENETNQIAVLDSVPLSEVNKILKADKELDKDFVKGSCEVKVREEGSMIFRSTFKFHTTDKDECKRHAERLTVVNDAHVASYKVSGWAGYVCHTDRSRPNRCN